jgi:hypothetical protein
MNEGACRPGGFGKKSRAAGGLARRPITDLGPLRRDEIMFGRPGSMTQTRYGLPGCGCP